MVRTFAAAALASCLLAAGSASAANERRSNKPAEYQTNELTEADRAAARERARHRMNEWRGDEPPPEGFKIPWMPIIFVSLTLMVAAPFGIYVYRQQARELREADAFAATSRRRRAAEAEE
jgi:Flp pilus assembly protein TadB